MLKRQLRYDKFPACCGILVASSTFVSPALLAWYPTPHDACKGSSNTGAATRREWRTRFLTTFFAALLSFSLLNYRRPSLERSRGGLAPPGTNEGQTLANLQDTPPEDISLEYRARALCEFEAFSAGKTLDLTFSALIRALDICFSTAWSRFGAVHRFSRSATFTSQALKRLTAPSMFATSSCIIMWAWFHRPDRLPRAYRTWISSAADIDQSLVQALREVRRGTFVYGKDTGRGPLLRSLCRELNFPEDWG